MKALQTSRRPGIALMFVVVVLMICSALLVSLTTQMVASHRMLDRRERQQQSLWLARSGLEIAAARLLKDPKYAGETTEVIPHGQLRITVEPDKNGNAFHVASEARFPTNLPEPVVRSVTQRYRRVTAGSSVTLEATGEDGKTAPPARVVK
jgi:hypothetical protein